MKKKIVIIAMIAIIVAGVLYFCYDYIKYANPIIDIHSCVSVKSIGGASEDKNAITEIANCINSAKKKRMIFPKPTLHSPTMIVSFDKEDGTKDSVWIYGEYVVYRSKSDKIQYKFDDVIKIYEAVEKYNLDE